MRNFRVQVNGNTYEVAVEETGISSNTTAPPPKTVLAPTQTVAPAPKVEVAPKADGSSVTAPMPGVVLDVKVKVGDNVTPNTVVAILEAMKMENEIFAGRTGTISAVCVDKGASVNTGDAIVNLG